MKRFIKSTVSLILLASVFAACGSFATAERRGDTVITMQVDNPQMTVYGININIDDGGSSPVIRDGRTLMPIRAFAESIGANVFWNGSQRTVTITYNGKKMLLTIDDTAAYVDYITQTLDVPPTIINDRTYLPVRFISESFGCEVNWNEETRGITIELKKDNLQHAAVVCDGEGEIYRASEIIADIIGADLYSADDTDLDLAGYETVLAGYYTEDGKLPEGIVNILAGDYKGKNIAPFCIGDIVDTEREISVAATGAYVEDGWEVPDTDEGEILRGALSWLMHLKLIQR